MRKKIFLSAAILAAAVSAYAQGNGQAGITEATNLITGYFDPGTKLVYAIGAVCGLIGGVKVYNKFSSGDPDTSKTAASWFGACIFLIVAATILRSSSKTAAMSEYPVNRGIGKPVEFKGLKSQYLFIFCGGLLAVFVVFIVLFMAGVNQWLCIGFIVSASLLLVWQTFRLNARYGTHGLMKAAARKRHPRFIISRKAIPRLFTYKKRKEERP